MNNTDLHWLLAVTRGDELRRAAKESRRMRPHPSPVARAAAIQNVVTLRYAFPDDRTSVANLAQLDSATVPAEPILLAEVCGELRAAMSLRDGTFVADPFYNTAALVGLLRARASQLAATATAAAPERRSAWKRWQRWRTRSGLAAWR